MRLKRLEILGFKSFADKTKLEFDAGITAVVGPNGCGKSNIADAFRWVLGEQSAKSLRGGKMPDVIFAGTHSRKPLNFAEVTITLTDIEGRLPIDFEEVSIARRLHRSGESEYFINRHPVRLKDVQSLLLDSGMGKDAYSIFEQGKIDQVINLSPLERRYIFEEAAGILRFLQRKKEALRKLEQADLNVVRVKDIHQEVEKQIIVLEQQAEKARQYKENKAELEKLEKKILVAKWEALSKRLSDAEQKMKEHESSMAATHAALEGFITQFSEAKQALDAAEKVLRKRSEEVFQTRSTKEIRSKEKQTNQERIKEIHIKEKRWQLELEAMIEKRRQRENERRTLQRSQKDTQKRHAEIEVIVQRQREKVNIAERELTKQREHQQLKQKELFKLLQNENQVESELKQIGLRLENAQERQQQAKERKERLSNIIKELLQQVEEKKRQLEESSQVIDDQKEVFASMEVSLQNLSEEMSKVEADQSKIHQEMTEAKARSKALQRLRDEMEGFSTGSKLLLQEAADASSPFFNKIRGLYEYFIPAKGSEAALASVMKPYAQTLVVTTEEDFDRVVAYAKQHQLKEVSLLCLETLAKSPTFQKKSASSELSPFMIHVIENELSKHFLKNIFVTKESKAAFKAMKNESGIEIWVNDGVFLDRHGVVFFATQGENNVFLREAELKALDKKLLESESEKLKLENILKQLHHKKNHLQSERIELDKVIRKGEMKLVEINFALQKLTTDMEKANTEDRLLKEELQAISRAIENHLLALDDLKKSHASAKNNAAETQKQVDALNALIDTMTPTLKEEIALLQKKETEFQQIVEETRKQQHAIHVLEVKDLESEQQEKRLEEEIEMGRLLQAQTHAKGADVDRLLEEVEKSLADVIAACAELEQEVAVRKNALEHLETKINDKRAIFKKSETERNQIEIQSAQLQSVCQSLENELLERHHLTLDQAREICGVLDKPLEQVEKQLRALRQQLESAGDINMTSIEECDKHKTRYRFLNEQIDDLNQSKQELVSIIAQLDDESRQIFKKAFDQICINFKKNFKILFQGGEADLQFTETADVLEAGIEIIAKPPGKQMRSINLLSGGEKCLTAMALLFAIFEVKPAPFCILDEIDAPLDDTNVERFVNIVKEFVDRCQFIIITHNKRTMAIADVIFGVSMEEKGVSKLLSMDFTKNSAPEPVLVS